MDAESTLRGDLREMLKEVYDLERLLARVTTGRASPRDLRFIARRIAVCAAEDVGNADPVATILAASALQVCEFVGLPEAQLSLAQAAIYVATAPKSNACSVAISEAMNDIRNGRTVEVPSHLRDSHYKGAEKLGHGLGYKYPHNYAGGFVEQDYLGQAAGKTYYEPKELGRKKTIREHLQKLWKRLG